MACSNDKAPSNPSPQQVIPPTNQPAPPINTNTVDNSATAAQNAAGQFHYVCPNGDPGGAGTAILCATCNTQLVHNQEFHNTTPGDPNAASPITANPAAPTNAAQNAAGEYHYACPNGHAGSGTAGNCATCGSQLAHNQAFHAGGAAPSITTSPTSPGQPISPIIQQPQTNTPTINVPSSPGSATNSRGEYHYTCPSGHAGAGAAGSCATCGAQLAHNQAYHN